MYGICLGTGTRFPPLAFGLIIISVCLCRWKWSKERPRLFREDIAHLSQLLKTFPRRTKEVKINIFDSLTGLRSRDHQSKPSGIALRGRPPACRERGIITHVVRRPKCLCIPRGKASSVRMPDSVDECSATSYFPRQLSGNQKKPMKNDERLFNLLRPGITR